MKTLNLLKLVGNFKNKQHFYTDELDSFNGDYDIYPWSRAQWWVERFTKENYNEIDNIDCINSSFPEFIKILKKINR